MAFNAIVWVDKRVGPWTWIRDGHQGQPWPEPIVQGEAFELRERDRLERSGGRRRLRHLDVSRPGADRRTSVRRRERVGVPDRRQLLPDDPIVGRLRPDRPARLASLHFEANSAAAAAHQRAGDMRADVGARFAVGTALERARRRARPLLGGKRPRHRPRV